MDGEAAQPTRQGLLEANLRAMAKFAQHSDDEALRELKGARSFLLESLGSRELREPEKAELQQVLAITNNNMACVYRRKRLPFSAMKLLQKSLRIQQRNAPKEVQAQTLLNLGVIYQELNKMDEAIGHFEKAIALTRGVESDTIDNFRLMAHYNIGCSCLRKRDLARALKHSREGTGQLFRNLEKEASRQKERQQEKEKSVSKSRPTQASHLERGDSRSSRLVQKLCRTIASRAQSRGNSQPRRRVNSSKRGEGLLAAALYSRSNRITIKSSPYRGA